METAFEMIMSLSETDLAGMYGDLEHHRLMYKGSCIYDGEFHDTSILQFPEDVKLFPNQHKYTQEEWVSMIATMYGNYANCIPKRCSHLNFIPAHRDELETLYCFRDFHHRRIVLDLFILFGYHAKLFSWNNPNYFMQRICDNCIVYRSWVI